MEYKKGKVLRKTANYRELYFYRKSDALYQLTVVFCRRFLPAYGDRTVDQMVQAARSGKQNIVEGSEAGMTSSESELKLLNVARSSIQELREDFSDYLRRHNLPVWDSHHRRSADLRQFCHDHNDYADFEPMAERLCDEELANLCLTLCHQIDYLMVPYLEKLEKSFVTEGGIKERMHAARTGYRQGQDEEMQALRDQVAALEKENRQLREQLAEKPENPKKP